MARPQKERRLLMNARLRIPVTEDQKKLVEEAANLEQLDVTAWIRPIILQAARERVQTMNAQKSSRK